jgi:hypothetical protein
VVERGIYCTHAKSGNKKDSKLILFFCVIQKLYSQCSPCLCGEK